MGSKADSFCLLEVLLEIGLRKHKVASKTKFNVRFLENSYAVLPVTHSAKCILHLIIKGCIKHLSCFGKYTKTPNSLIIFVLKANPELMLQEKALFLNN